MPDLNLIIEYDGEHHFQPVLFSKKDSEKSIIRFIEIQLKDEMKYFWCLDNEINLLRLSYKEGLHSILGRINQAMEIIQNGEPVLERRLILMLTNNLKCKIFLIINFAS